MEVPELADGWQRLELKSFDLESSMHMAFGCVFSLRPTLFSFFRSKHESVAKVCIKAYHEISSTQG